MNPPKQSTVDAAIDALNKVRRRWHRVPEVTATDVGFRIEGDTLTDTVALRVHVKRKRPVSELVPSEVFNEAGEQRTIDGFPVDVIEAAYASGSQPPLALEGVPAEQVNRRVRIRPLVGGISVGNPGSRRGHWEQSSSGGSRVSRFCCRTSTCWPGILRQRPVRPSCSRADRTAGATRPIEWPRWTAFGLTHEWMPPSPESIRGSHMTARFSASARSPARLHRPSASGGEVGPHDRCDRRRHRRVSTTIDYEGRIGVLTLTDQVHIVQRPPWPRIDREVAEGGDSGAIWLEEGTKRAVGLNFAGDNSPIPAAESAIGMPIGRVMAELDVSFLPVLCSPSAQAAVPRDLCDQFPRLRGLVRWQPRPSVPIHGCCHCCCSSGLDEQTLTELAELLDECRTE